MLTPPVKSFFTNFPYEEHFRISYNVICSCERDRRAYPAITRYQKYASLTSQ